MSDDELTNALSLAGRELTKAEILTYGSEVVLTKLHRESMQAGAEYAYFSVWHELEWDVYEKKVTRKYANDILKKLAEDFHVPAKTVEVSRVPLGYAMTPYRRRIRGGKAHG